MVERALHSHLEQLIRRHRELRDILAGNKLSGSDVARLSKEYSDLSPIVDDIEALRRARSELASVSDIARSAEDAELRALAEEEMRSLREKL